jgi:hypothetical protein
MNKIRLRPGAAFRFSGGYWLLRFVNTGIDFKSQQDNNGNQIDPDHESDDGTDGTV